MPDLDLQIRDYLDATSYPIEVDDVMFVAVGEGTVRPIAARPRTDVRRAWTAALAAAAAIVVVVGVAIVISSSRSDGPVGEPSTTVTVAEQTIGPEATQTPAPTTDGAEVASSEPRTSDMLPMASQYGWTRVQINLDEADGRPSDGLARDGTVLATTSGVICTKRTWSDNMGDGLGLGPAVECDDDRAERSFAGHEWTGAAWARHEAFPGKYVYPDGVIGGMTHQIVCDGPLEGGSASCEYWSSTDGIEWFQIELWYSSEVTDRDEKAGLHRLLHGAWSWHDHRILIQIQGDELRDALTVGWATSFDRGQSFQVFRTEQFPSSVASFTVDGEFRSIRWSSLADVPPILWEMRPDATWRELGATTGLPAAGDLCDVRCSSGEIEVFTVGDGSLFMVANRWNRPRVARSDDGGFTWEMLEPRTVGMPAVPSGDWIAGPTDSGWLVISTTSGPHVATNGDVWVQIPREWWERGRNAWSSLPVAPAG